MKTTIATLSSTPQTLSAPAFYRLVAQSVVVDGRAGGLICGRKLDEGGILVIRQRGESFVIQEQRVEGGDFVLNEDVQAPDYVDEFRARTCGARLGAIRSITTEASPDDKILWLKSKQVVVPQETVAGCLNLLNLINDYRNRFAFCDLEDLFELPQAVQEEAAQ